MTYDAWRFTPAARVLSEDIDARDPRTARRLLSEGYLVLHEGKTFWHYDDQWGDPPRYLVALEQIADKRVWLDAARYYRLAFRDIAGSTNERTSVFTVLPAGVVCGNTAPVERKPGGRSSAAPLYLASICNTYVFDWAVRVKSASHLNLFILDGCPIPSGGCLLSAKGLLVHATLRLTCNHVGYEPLWREQLGETWREPKPSFTWPALEGDDERWPVRAAIDAVVAAAYGLTRAQYEHVLSTFNHKSYLKAPELCVAAFDELKEHGLAAFTRKHDPYSDVPLNENLPQPVIELPIAADLVAEKSRRRRQGSIPVAGSREEEGQLGDNRANGEFRLRPPLSQPALPFGSDFTRAVEGALKAHPADEPARPEGRLDSDTYQLVRRLLDERRVISSTDAQALTGLGAAAVRPYLQRLIADGLATPEGRRRGLRYRRVAIGAT